jgi:C-terminal processing protease CtpA/Prc
MKNWTALLLILVFCGAVILLTLQHRTIGELRADLAQQNADSVALSAPPKILVAPPASDEQQSDHNELLRLRNEVSQLRRERNELRTQMQVTSNNLLQMARSVENRTNSRQRGLGADGRTFQAGPEDVLPRAPRVGAWIGIRIQEVGELAEVTGTTSGVMVGDVRKGGPADAKLKQMDVILKVDGQEVRSRSDLTGLLGQKSAGQPMILDIMRDKMSMQVEITPGEWPP